MSARLSRLLLAIGLALLPLGGAAETRLLMIEQAGCVYCARWDAEIGPIYGKTPEGKAAPLVRADLRGPLPDGVETRGPAVFTPTFILLQDGREAGRIEGYPGEDFFWGLLGQMLDQTNAKGVAPPAG